MKDMQCHVKSVQTLVTRRYDTTGKLVAWTDGACEPNPGRGGWGVRIERDGKMVEEIYGGDPDTTNNRMEMQAVIEAVRRTKMPIIIRTDSQLVLLCAVGRWKRKKNVDLWAEYDKVAAGRDVKFEWWRGHVGTPGNERADALAELGRFAESNPPLDDDHEYATISVRRFRDPAGNPTCCADHPAGKTCRFLGVTHFGTRDTCMLGEQQNLDSIDGYTRPDERCEVWKVK